MFLPLQWAGVLSRLALEQERILNPVLDRVRTADHHQLRSLTGLIRNLSRHARNKDEMCECWGGQGRGGTEEAVGMLSILLILSLASTYLQACLSTFLRLCSQLDEHLCGVLSVPSDQTSLACSALPPAPLSSLAVHLLPQPILHTAPLPCATESQHRA